MSFGQHARVGDNLKQERAAGYREPQKDGGYPTPREEVKSGRMTKGEILAGADVDGLVKARKTAHNELTLLYTDGRIACRFRETDIVQIFPDGSWLINTGGWNTISTRRHVMDFFARRNFKITMWGDKKGGGNGLRIFEGPLAGEYSFARYVHFNSTEVVSIV